MSNAVHIRPAYVRWLSSRVAALETLHRSGLTGDMIPLAQELSASAAAAGYLEVEAAAAAVRRLARSDDLALGAALEILRRVVKRAVRQLKRDAA